MTAPHGIYQFSYPLQPLIEQWQEDNATPFADEDHKLIIGGVVYETRENAPVEIRQLAMAGFEIFIRAWLAHVEQLKAVV